MTTLEASLNALGQETADDAAGVVSWVHIGDLHTTDADGQNLLDLRVIVDEVNGAFKGASSFVYLPGDIANEGSAEEYAMVREALDELKVPWFTVIGDHDVHERSFANYLASMSSSKHYGFVVGTVRFLALNAFDEPDPGCFCVMDAQMEWVRREIADAKTRMESVVILMHCYPSDLKRGGQRLRELMGQGDVRVVDMGHTHYNEVANDGRVIYTATRSTGQIEEGSVGFSVTNIDNGCVSWKFFELDALPAVMITTPVDEHFVTESTLETLEASQSVVVRVKIWDRDEVCQVTAVWGGQEMGMAQVQGSNVWQAEIDVEGMAEGTYTLSVSAATRDGRSGSDRIRFVHGLKGYTAPLRKERDQDNAIDAWPERGLLGTQLGPNKNGRKW
ncbi:MAG: metallophosphoesterase [Acidobacteria bacterium]|nr:metallophosphoesterase [Acidobacteriota bacterium]